MDTFSLVAATGRETGSAASRRLRREGQIPGIVYGHGIEPTAVAVDRLTFRRVLNEAGANALITLDVDGSPQLTILKNLQRDPVADRVVHIDFQVVTERERMLVDVPIVLEGEAVAVGREGGVVQQQLNSLTVSAPAMAIPQSLTLDVSEMTMNDQFHVYDIDLPADVTTDVEPDTVVVVAQYSRAALALEEEEAAEAAELEAEEAEAGEAADAGDEDTSADGDDSDD